MAFLAESDGLKHWYMDRFVGGDESLKEWVYITPDAVDDVLAADYFDVRHTSRVMPGDLIRIYTVTDRDDLSTTTAVTVVAVKDMDAGEYKHLSGDISEALFAQHLTARTGVANGVAGLGSNSRLIPAQHPDSGVLPFLVKRRRARETSLLIKSLRGPQLVRPIGEELPFKSYRTTGSITAGSDQLVLADNPGFQVGDQIIVEIGTETGRGQRGTEGVGGTWPALSYADVATMNADTGQAANTFAWVEDSGDVYQFVSSAWTSSFTGKNYYTEKAIPKSLVTTITNIATLTLTLDDSSVAAATNANVYFDNHPAWVPFGAFGASAPLNGLLVVPEGEFAFSNRLFMNALDDRELTGYGDTRSGLFSPMGVPCFEFKSGGLGGAAGPGSDATKVRHLYARGNVRKQGFGLTADVTETTLFPVNAFAYSRGIWFRAINGGEISDVKVTDCFQSVVTNDNCDGFVARRCRVFETDPMMAYVQWKIQVSSTTDWLVEDCSIDSDWMVHGFEAFQSHGGAFKRITGRNAGMAMNSSGGDWLIEDMALLIEEDSRNEVSDIWSATNPLLNINTNSGTPSELSTGGRVVNPMIVTEGPMDDAGNIPAAIVVNASNPEIRISGGYIEAPDGTLAAATGVTSDGMNTVVDGLHVVGANANASYGNIKVPASGIVRYCVADLIVGGTQTDNQPNEPA